MEEWESFWERKSREGVLVPTLMEFRIPSNAHDETLRLHARAACPSKWRDLVRRVELDRVTARGGEVVLVRLWIEAKMQDVPISLTPDPESEYSATPRSTAS